MKELKDILENKLNNIISIKDMSYEQGHYMAWKSLCTEADTLEYVLNTIKQLESKWEAQIK